jgi:hypothetical protein
MYEKCFPLQQTQKEKRNNFSEELIDVKERSKNEQIVAAEEFVAKLLYLGSDLLEFGGREGVETFVPDGMFEVVRELAVLISQLLQIARHLSHLAMQQAGVVQLALRPLLHGDTPISRNHRVQSVGLAPCERTPESRVVADDCHFHTTQDRQLLPFLQQSVLALAVCRCLRRVALYVRHR